MHHLVACYREKYQNNRKNGPKSSKNMIEKIQIFFFMDSPGRLLLVPIQLNKLASPPYAAGKNQAGLLQLRGNQQFTWKLCAFDRSN